MIMVAPSEPQKLSELLFPAGPVVVSPAIETAHGVDILFLAQDKLCGVQRKVFPGDFLASLRDGRWARQEALMLGTLDRILVVLEGHPRWLDGELVHSYMSFSKARLWGLCWALEEKGAAICWTDSLEETAKAVLQWRGRCSRRTDSGLSRILPKRSERDLDAVYRDHSGVIDRKRMTRDLQEQFLEGLKGVSRGRARMLLKHYGSLKNVISSILDGRVTEVKGIGKVVSRDMIEFLSADYPGEVDKGVEEEGVKAR